MKLTDLRKYMIERRKRLGLSQADVALRMGADQSAVSRLEGGGVSDPGINTIARWASALDLVASLQLRETGGVTFDLDASPAVAE